MEISTANSDIEHIDTRGSVLRGIPREVIKEFSRKLKRQMKRRSKDSVNYPLSTDAG